MGNAEYMGRSKNTIMAGPGTSVITAHELARMKVSIDEGQGIMPPANPHELRSKRVRLQKISQDRVSRWPNTLEAERKKKEARRQQRHDEEEVQRKKIDKEEAAIQGEKRRMAIERANKMLYDDNDRVKSFHSALLLSDVMKEREAQIEVTRQRTKNERRRDKHWAMMQDEAIEEYDRKEIDKKTEVQRKRYEVAVARESQPADLKKVIADGKKDKEREGQLIIQKAQMEIAKARREEQARVEEAKRQVDENKKVNALLKTLQQEELQRELLEEEGLHQIALEKESKLMERKRREMENKRLADEKKQRILDHVQQLRLAGMSDEEERVENQVKEKAEADAAEAERRLERKRRELAEIKRSRNEQLKRKEMVRDDQVSDEKEWAAQWTVAKERLQVEDEGERARVRQRNVDVTNFNIQLREEKKMERQVVRQTHLEAAHRANEILEEEEERFGQYTTACMNEWHLQGKSCKPMRILLSKGDSVTE